MRVMSTRWAALAAYASIGFACGSFGATPAHGQTEGTGDLRYPWECRASFYGGDLPVHLEMTAQYNGGDSWSNRSEASGIGFAETWLSAAAPALLRDYSVECLIDYYAAIPLYDGQYYMLIYHDDLFLTLEGAGPETVDTVIDAFIPYEYISIPDDVLLNGYDKVAEGDNRSFSYTEYGDARIRMRYGIWNSAVFGAEFLNEPTGDTGLSQDYDAESSLSAYPGFNLWWPFNYFSGWTENAPAGGYLLQDARDDWIAPDRYLKVNFGVGQGNTITCDSYQRLGAAPDDPNTSQVSMHCVGVGYHPFSPVGTPPIRWDLNLLYTFGHNGAKVALSGCTGWFPAYEVYAARVPVVQRTDSGNPGDLGSGCSATISQEIVIR